MARDPKAALQAHEVEVGKLSRLLAQLGAARAGEAHPRADAVLLTAHLMRHRISMALLTSRIDSPLPRG